jgi:multiple sugar transport system ATP-binding protein
VLQQVDTPQRLYDRPANLFVGEFIGSPAMNLVGADLVRENGRIVAKFGDHALPIPFELLASRPELRAFEGRRLILGIRPEDLEDASLVSDAPADRRLRAVVDVREDMGSEVFLHFAAGGPPVRGTDVQAAVGEETVEVETTAAGERGSLFVARVGRETTAREGETVELVVDPRRLHFFATETGLAISNGLV